MTHNWTNIPNSTETMAERAWRYGKGAAPGEFFPGWLYDLTIYADHSATLSFRCGVPEIIFSNWAYGK